MGSGDLPKMGSVHLKMMGPGDLPKMGSVHLKMMGPGDLPKMGSGDLQNMGSGGLKMMGCGDLPKMGSGELQKMGSRNLQKMRSRDIQKLLSRNIPKIRDLQKMGSGDFQKMGSSVILNLKRLTLAVTLLCLLSMKGTTAQTPGPVTALETDNVDITFLIPATQQAAAAAYITIRHRSSLGSSPADVGYLLKDGPRVTERYAERLQILQQDERVTLRLRNVTAADAGVFRCFPSGGTSAISDCGQLLIIIRKPDPPSVSVSPASSLLVGSDTQLLCQPNSTSLPEAHGLTSEIFWYDHSGKPIDTFRRDRRISVNTQSQLVIERLGREDKGLKFQCVSADNAGSARKRILSDPSPVFEVIPEYKPSHDDLRLSPDLSSDETVRKVLGQTVRYRCGADCQPPCEAYWLYKPHGSSAGFGKVPIVFEKGLLSLDVSRINEGSYRCRAENKHGSVRTGFHLEAMYMGYPAVSINGMERRNIRVMEGSHVNLSCVFDSNPRPTVTWTSPQRTVLSVKDAEGLVEKLANNGVYTRSHTSFHTLTHLQCEDSGVYKCEGKNSVSSGQGLMDLMVMCPPVSAGVSGLDLQPEYVWAVPQPLRISFVVRTLPPPEIFRIMSSVRGQHRREEIPTDFAVMKESNHEGKPYLTKFTLTSRRPLSMSDKDRVFIVTTESSEFKEDFMFTIRPRGPPYEVLNLTAGNVGHSSLTLSWAPSFNGGEPQMFSVQLCSPGPQSDGNDPHLLCSEDQDWTTILQNVPEEEGTGREISVEIGSLQGSTGYMFRVLASNSLGTTTATVKVITIAPPDKSLSAGTVAGIVVGVILVVVVVIVAVLYFIYYRRYHGRPEDDKDKDDDDHEAGEARQSMLPKKITLLFKRDKNSKSKPEPAPVDAAVDGGDYDGAPTVKPLVQDDDTTYADLPILNNNKDDEKTKESGDKLVQGDDDDGLNYSQIQFSSDKHSPETRTGRKTSEHKVHYADINFTETAARRAEMEKEDGDSRSVVDGEKV